MSYHVLAHALTVDALEAYRSALVGGVVRPGARLASVLGEVTPALTREALLDALLATKAPRIYAESEVRGDGSDWSAAELSILGDVGVATEVSVFDDGLHRRPCVHAAPMRGWLLFSPGVLLRNDRGHEPADWATVVRSGTLDPDRYDALVERRLLPLFRFASDRAAAEGLRALVTVPGLGCGQFAGPFAGKMGAHLERALRRMLERHAARLLGLRAVYFDPYAECDNRRHELGHVSLLVRPLTRGNDDRPQLCPPGRYADPEDDFEGCRLFSVVAWDHVSWPGNDFYAGARATDDGVKAAATDSMRAMTGVSGAYDEGAFAYLPPAPWDTWEQVVREKRLRMSAAGRWIVVDAEASARASF